MSAEIASIAGAATLPISQDLIQKCCEYLDWGARITVANSKNRSLHAASVSAPLHFQDEDLYEMMYWGFLPLHFCECFEDVRFGRMSESVPNPESIDLPGLSQRAWSRIGQLTEPPRIDSSNVAELHAILSSVRAAAAAAPSDKCRIHVAMRGQAPDAAALTSLLEDLASPVVLQTALSTRIELVFRDRAAEPSVAGKVTPLLADPSLRRSLATILDGGMQVEFFIAGPVFADELDEMRAQLPSHAGLSHTVTAARVVLRTTPTSAHAAASILLRSAVREGRVSIALAMDNSKDPLSHSSSSSNTAAPATVVLDCAGIDHLTVVCPGGPTSGAAYSLENAQELRHLTCERALPTNFSPAVLPALAELQLADISGDEIAVAHFRCLKGLRVAGGDDDDGDGGDQKAPRPVIVCRNLPLLEDFQCSSHEFRMLDNTPFAEIFNASEADVLEFKYRILLYGTQSAALAMAMGWPDSVVWHPQMKKMMVVPSSDDAGGCCGGGCCGDGGLGHSHGEHDHGSCCDHGHDHDHDHDCDCEDGTATADADELELSGKCCGGGCHHR